MERSEDHHCQLQVYKVDGMSCSACATSLETALRKVQGVEAVNVNFATEKASIKYDSDLVSNKSIFRAGKSVGFKLYDQDLLTKKVDVDEVRSVKRKMCIAAVFTVPIFLISMFFSGVVPEENWIMLLFSLPVLFYSGFSFIRNALLRLRYFSTNMDTLVFVGTQSAFWYSVFSTVDATVYGGSEPVYFESAAVIVSFVLVGKFLEARSKNKATAAIYDLMTLQPERAVIIRSGEEIEVSQEALQEGDLVIVRPGGRIPVDGIIEDGISSIDEKMFTGEPVARMVRPEDRVMAGSMNIDGRLQIRMTHAAQLTYLARIVQRIEEAQSTKAPVQELADKVSSSFVPTILVVALLTFIVWFFMVPDTEFAFALRAFVAVLIIACPCALGLATPTAMAVAIGTAAKHGIFIKNTRVLQNASTVTDVVLDKTGTITLGEPTVKNIIWKQEVGLKKYESILRSIASQSNHPLARAIANHFEQDQMRCEDVMNFPGRGVSCSIEGLKYWLGSSRWLEGDVSLEQVSNERNNDQALADSVVWLVEENRLVATVSLEDKIKPQAYDLVEQIHLMGLNTHMLTGDRKATADAIAMQSGIGSWGSELLPEDKADYIAHLQNTGRTVAMVGDGVNDGPALSVAKVSIALSTGEDLTKETADVTLSGIDIAGITKVMWLSKLTMRRIRQNLGLAFIYNVIAIPIAAGVLFPWTGMLLSPMIAGATMALSSVSVVTNSLRLKYENFADR